jgi:hypothetical protein
MIWGLVRWFRRTQPRTLPSILSLIGFTLATASVQTRVAHTLSEAQIYMIFLITCALAKVRSMWSLAEKRGLGPMATLPMHFRLEAADWIEEYRIHNGDVEVRQLQYPIEEDRVWYRLTAEDLKGHVDRNTVVAQWLKHRMGWRPLLRACVAEQNLYDLDRAESTADRRAA